MSWSKRFIFLVMLLCSFAVSEKLSGQIDFEYKDGEKEKLAFVFEGVKDQLELLIRDRADLGLDFLQRRLERKDIDFRKAKVYAKGLGARFARQFDEQVYRSFKLAGLRVKGDVITVNGERYVREGGEQEQEPCLEVKMFQKGDFRLISVYYVEDRASTGTAFTPKDGKPLMLWKDPNFRKCLDGVSEEEVEEVYSQRFTKRTQAFREGVIISLKELLYLNDEETSQFKVWLNSNFRIEPSAERPFEEQLKSEVEALFKLNPPAFLSEAQKARWGYLKSPSPLGW